MNTTDPYRQSRSAAARSLLLLSCLCAAVMTACDGESSSADTVPRQTLPVDAAEFCTELARARCVGIQKCCTELSGRYDGEETCRDGERLRCDALHTSVLNSDAVTVNPVKAGQLVAAAATSSAACEPDSDSHALVYALEPALEPGATCDPFDIALTGNPCRDGYCRSEDAPGSGQCVAMPGAGSACPAGVCAEGLFCDDGSCKRPTAEGVECKGDQACDGDTRCIFTQEYLRELDSGTPAGDGPKATCQLRRPNGEPAYVSEDCASNLIQLAQPPQHSTCVACRTHTDCQGWFSGPNESLGLISAVDSTTGYCDDGVCKGEENGFPSGIPLDRPKGAGCGEDVHCQSLRCEASGVASGEGPERICGAPDVDALFCVTPLRQAVDGGVPEPGSLGKVCEGDFEIDIEAQLAAIEDCETITGTLEFDTDLDEAALPRLVRVGGLSITRYDHLTRLGLPALTTIDGGLSFNSDRMERLELPALATVGGDFSLYTPNSITELILPVLTTIGARLSVDSADELRRLVLPELTQAGSVSLYGDGALESFAAPKLEEAGGLYLSGCHALATVQLPALAAITKGLTVEYCPMLDLLELPALREIVDGNVKLEYNDGLTSVSMPALEAAVDGIAIRENPSLAEVFFPVLTRVHTEGAGSLSIARNDSLVGVELPMLEATSTFSIHHNAVLVDVSLPLLKQTGNASVIDNGSLQALRLPALKTFNDLNIASNALLATIDLPALTRTTGLLRIEDNGSLTAIELAMLVDTDAFFVFDNPSLPTLHLPALQSSGAFEIQRNAALMSLTAPMIESFTGVYWVTDNPMLSTDEVLALAEQGSAIRVRSDGNL